MLLVIGASVALSVDRLLPTGAAPVPAASAAADAISADASSDVASGANPSDLSSADPSDLSSANPSADPSEDASASPSPAAPLLEAALPRSVNGTTLTVESVTGDTIFGGDPNSRALSAAIGTLGKAPSDLELADAYDESQTVDLTVLAFRLPGVDPGRLRPVVLAGWLSANLPGVTSSKVSLSGVDATRVSYGDEGVDAFVYIRGDTVFVIETADEALAASVVKNMAAAPSSAPGGSPAASPSPSGT